MRRAGSQRSAPRRTLIRANPVQRGNRRLLEHFRKVVTFDAAVRDGDFVAGGGTVVFFLSYRFHAADRAYLPQHVVPAARRAGEQAVLLLVVDDPAPDEALLAEVNVAAFHAPLVLVTVLSYAEAAHVIEEYGVVRDAARDEGAASTRSRVVQALALTRLLSTADAQNLLAHFVTFKRLAQADKEELRKAKKMGPKKAESVWRLFHTPLTRSSEIVAAMGRLRRAASQQGAEQADGAGQANRADTRRGAPPDGAEVIEID